MTKKTKMKAKKVNGMTEIDRFHVFLLWVSEIHGECSSMDCLKKINGTKVCFFRFSFSFRRALSPDEKYHSNNDSMNSRTSASCSLFTTSD
jgi:fructose-bisphosphate aldolase class 1